MQATSSKYQHISVPASQLLASVASLNLGSTSQPSPTTAYDLGPTGLFNTPPLSQRNSGVTEPSATQSFSFFPVASSSQDTNNAMIWTEAADGFLAAFKLSAGSIKTIKAICENEWTNEQLLTSQLLQYFKDAGLVETFLNLLKQKKY